MRKPLGHDIMVEQYSLPRRGVLLKDLGQILPVFVFPLLNTSGFVTETERSYFTHGLQTLLRVQSLVPILVEVSQPVGKISSSRIFVVCMAVEDVLRAGVMLGFLGELCIKIGEIKLSSLQPLFNRLLEKARVVENAVQLLLLDLNHIQARGILLQKPS
ncbi:MAG: hypothetical protein QF815_00055 [Candidatus Peribacteraceae bacterium]|nr:hypothetical protein [Candidatus Peribacteraceae bacterium]